MYLPMDSAFLNALATSARAIDKISTVSFHQTGKNARDANPQGTQSVRENTTWPGAASGVRVAAGPWKYWADVIAHFFWLHHQL